MEPPSLILASRSPRRRALLEQIGVRFEIVDIDLDETRRPGEAPEDYVLRLALDKARAGRARVGSSLRPPVLAADTAVVVGDRILGKPRDRADAAAMLRLLAERTHRVLSGVALVGADEERALSVSEVRFRAVSARETDAYWESGEPRDKAGGYAIQGLGALFVAELRGSYSGVMGLPLFETARLLAAVGIDCLSP
ncbi:MAG: Maf family nucleotide pyrophosphatase [Candidatus Thiosymbion ectosymbiont of Robbea hypermnestra]|nr:Maf family nucleotide pyrophosphatase [Candidatus Thiosymbion ectosymbiont of Robbea hypermnestra]